MPPKNLTQNGASSMTEESPHVLRDPSSLVHPHHTEPVLVPVQDNHGFVTRFFVKHKTYTAFLLVVITAIIFYIVFSIPKSDQETYSVVAGSIKQYVKVSGNVEAIEDADLSFQTSGAVSFVGVKTDDKVTQGKVLATLTAGDAQASLLQAQANLAAAQALLSQLRQGARPEEIAIKQQNLENAKSSLAQSYNALPDTIQNVDAVTADVIKNKFASLFVLNNSKYILSFSSCDQQLQTEIENKRTDLEDSLAAFQAKSTVITALSSQDTIDATFEAAYQASLLTNDLVNSVSNLLLTSCSLTNPSLDNYRANLSGVKTTMTGLFSDITAKRTALLLSKNSLSQASRDLDLTKAGTDPYKIRAQVAVVDQASAAVKQAQSGLDKTILKSPFNGTVSRVDLSLGETVTPGKSVISIIAEGGYQIEAKIPEIDIVKVKVGNVAEVTLDAYGNGTVFPATVTRINPTATTEGTVPVYTAIVTFTGSDARVKQGMTANVHIVTDNKDDTIVVPARFIKVVDDAHGTATTLSQGVSHETSVGLGIRGEDGLIEITNGLVPGDVVLPPTTTVHQAQKQNN